ncbi:MAG: hypothetical protein HWE20_16930 [Gammaproteobacteria bacterium]|nr:hypothetical protein [Gammaproteobacteria bacterium]
MNTINALIASLTAVAISSSAYSANCAKNPNHSSCQQPPSQNYGSSLPLVVNGDGTVLGRAFNLNWEQVYPGGSNPYPMKMSADLRLVHQVGEEEHGYAVRVYSDGIEQGFNGYTGALASFDQSCTSVSYPRYVLIPPWTPVITHNLAPFLSEQYVVIRASSTSTSISNIAVGDLAIVKLGAEVVSVPEDSLVGLMSEDGSACERIVNTSTYQKYEVLDFKWVSGQFIAPITFELR